MILALVIFAVTYLLMLALPKERPWVALCSAAVFMALGQLGVYDFSLSAALGAVEPEVLPQPASRLRLSAAASRAEKIRLVIMLWRSPLRR